MEQNATIFVAGHRGLVGSAIVRQLQHAGYTHLLTRSRSELDLLDQGAVEQFFAQERPEYLFLAAAKVGGIHANNTYPADFIYENLLVESLLIHAAWRYRVKGLLFLGSSCIYPQQAPQPMAEEALLSGPLEPTNEPYAVAKIAGIKLCESYNRQHGTRFRAVMPTNLYGEGDNFHPENSHVIPALMRRFHEAKERGDEEVTVWGSGQAMREFLHVEDMAAACLHVMQLPDAAYQQETEVQRSHLNIGTGEDVTIRELAETLREVIGFTGELRFDTSRPDGTPRKRLDVSRIHRLGWHHRIDLRSGLQRTYRWYCENQQQLRS